MQSTYMFFSEAMEYSLSLWCPKLDSYYLNLHFRSIHLEQLGHMLLLKQTWRLHNFYSNGLTFLLAVIYLCVYFQYYKQQCKNCDTWCIPYRVEETRCSRCNKVAKNCNCDKTQQTDPNKPHMSGLCEKCRSGRPCP